MGASSCEQTNMNYQKGRGRTVYQNNISLLDTFLSQNTRKNLNLTLKLFVCIFLFGLCYGAIPYDGYTISVARLYVPIDSIVTGRYFTAGEPFPMNMRHAASELLCGFIDCF